MGTVTTDKKCYLNDDEEIINLEEDIKCKQYCENGECSLDENKEPYCKCGDNYKGLYCEMKIDDSNLEENFKKIINKSKNS